MKFIRDLIGKRRHQDDDNDIGGMEPLEQSYRDTIGSIAEETQALQLGAQHAVREVAVSDVLTNVSAKVKSAETPAKPVAKAPETPVNIWDMDDDGISTELAAMVPAAPEVAAAAATRSPGRARRNKTRLIGFDKSDGDVVDLFNDAPRAAPTQRVKFPVGWLVVSDGPGRGQSFALLAGMSQIGRGEDQAIQLDFGDNSISRSNHAAIVYDPESHEFLLGHGGKSNIVRLNDKPLISNETLKTGDLIRIGETVLRFVALCGKSFNWANGATEEDDDVAIA